MGNDIKNELKNILNQGIFKHNPVFVLALALTPVLAVSNTIGKALGLGMTVLFIMVLSNLIVSIFKSKLSDEVMTIVTLAIVAFFVTVAEMIIQVRNIALYEDLGIYLPLTAVSGLILHRALSFSKQNNVIKSVVDGFAYGVGYLVALIIITIVRVIISTGSMTLFNMRMQLFDSVYSFDLADTAFGALLIVGLILGIFKTFQQRGETK
ncbi:MAG: hypothetical protein K9L02_00335 [Acholeplasmataceae bacterium]|nr:hypothetical protein [Acholeplasmataceae bacterium]